MKDIVLIDKPKGITSFGIIRKLRRKLGIRKIGHAGTLDPLASGLLIIGIGEGTKKLNQFLKLPKEYIADILIGERRSTGDMEGEILDKKDVPLISGDEIRGILENMLGTLTLPVPIYSAVKRGGQPLYKKARKAEKTGEKIKAPVRKMEVREAALISHSCKNERCNTRVRFVVASGVYIRSLAEEFGRRLGYPATLADLRRTKIGKFDIKNAQKL